MPSNSAGFKQFYVFVALAILSTVLDLVDAAFGNYISLDSICVLATTTTVNSFLGVVSRAGEYAYRIKMKNYTECLMLGMICAVACSAIMIFGHVPIVHLFNLTERQYELLDTCLIIKGLFIPFARYKDFMDQYASLNCQNKCLVRSSLIFWVIDIVLDAVVVFCGWECYYLVLTTGIAHVASSIYYVVRADYKLEKPDLQVLLGLQRGVFDMIADRFMGRIAGTVVSVASSNLGTELYAVQSVTNNVVNSCYEITDACFRYQLLSIRPIDDLKKRLKACEGNIGKLTLQAVIIGYTVSVVLLFFIHGKVSIMQVLMVTLVYCTVLFVEPVTNSYKGYLTSCEKTRTLCFSGFLGICVKVPLALLSIYTPLSVWGIALCDVGHSIVCCLYFRSKSKKLSLTGM